MKVYFVNPHHWSSGGIGCYGTEEAPTEFLLGLKMARSISRGREYHGAMEGGTPFIRKCVSLGIERNRNNG